MKCLYKFIVASDLFLCRCHRRKLQAEYDRLKKAHDRKGLSPLPSPPEMLPVSPQSARDAELIAEAKLLRQHKGRLEARMQILEDHNKQLESQLHRLRQLLEQVHTPYCIYWSKHWEANINMFIIAVS